MEYVLAFVTMVFGFMIGRIYGIYKGSSFERGLAKAVMSGEKLQIIVGKKGLKSELINGKIVHSSFELVDEIKVDEE